MKRKIECEIARTEGSLLRVLGLIERRGHVLHDLTVRVAGPGRFQLSLVLESQRDAEVLVRQLERLFDVHDAFLLPLEAALVHADVHAGPDFRASWLAG